MPTCYGLRDKYVLHGTVSCDSIQPDSCSTVYCLADLHKYHTLEKIRFMVNLRQRKMFQIMICVRPSPIYLL